MDTALMRGLESKPVLDYNRMPLGTVLGASFDPKTRDPTELIISLHPQARERLHARDDTLTVPFDFVFGIRRDAVTLSRSLPEMMGIFAENRGSTRRLEEAVLNR